MTFRSSPQLNDPESLLDSENFKSARLITSGKMRFGAKLKAGQSWMQSLDAVGGAVPMRLKADASYTLDWVKTGEFRFSIGRARRGSIAGVADRVTEEARCSIAVDRRGGKDRGIAPGRRSVDGTSPRPCPIGLTAS